MEIIRNRKCEICKSCGGCSYLNEEYEKTLRIKTENVKALVKKAKLMDVIVKQTVGMENPYNYRNKGKFAFGFDKQKKPVMGFFEEGTHTVLPFKECLIQNEIINEVANFVFELVKKYKIVIYNEDTQKGFLRHLIVKYGIKSRRNYGCICNYK